MGDWLDRLRVSYHYLRTVRRPLNLGQPRAFTEKVQLAKLTWRSPRMVALADKVESKKVAAALLGPEWVTPTIFAGAALPPRSDRNWPVPYVIKCNHRSGGNHFVLSADPDWAGIERSVARQLSRRYGRRLAEWVYTQIPPQVLVEPYLGNPGVPPDYKLHLFGGKFGFTLVNWDRFSVGGMQRATFDRAWKRLPFSISSDGDYQGDDLPRRPASYEEMISGAETLVQGFPFARVDLYEIGGRPRFGEVTFYLQSGYLRMPRRHDLEIGAMWPAGVPT